LVRADSAAVLLPGVNAGWLLEAQLAGDPWMEAIIGPCAGGVPPRTAGLLIGIIGRPPVCEGTGCEVGLGTRPASCLTLWSNAEPIADPALTVAAAEFAFNKTDSAAAWAKAEAPGKVSAKAITKSISLFKLQLLAPGSEL